MCAAKDHLFGKTVTMAETSMTYFAFVLTFASVISVHVSGRGLALWARQRGFRVGVSLDWFQWASVLLFVFHEQLTIHPEANPQLKVNICVCGTLTPTTKQLQLDMVHDMELTITV